MIFTTESLPPFFHRSTTSLVEGIDRQPVKILLRKIQVPLLSILLFILVGSALAITLLYRHLIRPMDQMAVAARRIIEGDLEISMPEYRCYEVNELGRSFNDLSTNLQEVILLVWNYLRDSKMKLDRMIEDEPRQGQGTDSSADATGTLGDTGGDANNRTSHYLL